MSAPSVPVECARQFGDACVSSSPVAPSESTAPVDPVPAAEAELGAPWVTLGVVVILGVAAVVFLALWLTTAGRLRRLRNDVGVALQPTAAQGPASSTVTAPSVPAGPPPELVDELITLADLAGTPALAAQARRVLATLGVQEVCPAVGDRFDSYAHAAAGVNVTDDAARADTIATVVRVGWARSSRIVRPADVVVWSVR